jgi:hypothetical protein
MRAAVARAAIRRGCVWPIRPVVPRPSSRTDLRDLRRLARAGFAADDHHLVLRDQRRDLVAAPVDRQIVGKLRFRQARPARGDGRARALEQAVALGLQRIALGAEEVPQIARQRAQTALVERQAVGERVIGQKLRARDSAPLATDTYELVAATS